MKNIRVLIVDDHILIREGLRKILSLEAEIEVIAEAADGQEAIDLARKLSPDVILLDINMPKVNGITACRIIKEENPQIGIIALTIHDQQEYLFEMIRSGISGYTLKDVCPEQLIKTIHGVADGQSFLPPSMTSKVFKEFSRISEQPEQTEHEFKPGLTERETEILQELAHGKTNKEIAIRLVISEKTVKNHLTNIFQKLNVSDRTQAALLAIKHDLVKL